MPFFTLTGAPKADNPPNIIIIFADDLGIGDVSCYNPDARIKTPHIDALAKDGMRFTAGHATSSVCTPSRYSILTGRYNWRTHLKGGVLGGYDMPLIDSSRTTIADILQQKGYNTACIGKWHLGLEYATEDGKKAYFDFQNKQTNIRWNQPMPQTPNDLGFDYFYGISASADMPPYMYIEDRKFVTDYDTIKGDSKYTRTDMRQFFRPGPASDEIEPESFLPDFTAKAVSYIQEQTQDKPFFMYYPLTAPHKPIAPSQGFKGKTDLHTYLDFCIEVDHTVGEIVKTLKEKGLYENTMIIFTSDNGFAPYVDVKFLENHGHYPSYIYRGYKADIWEGGHRVPLIVTWPGKVQSSTISNEVVSLVDLFATTAEIVNADFEDNAGEDSYNILPVLLNEPYQGPLREATVFHSIRGEFAIQQGPWKLILCNEERAGGMWVPDKRLDSTQVQTPYLLYNLQEDPEELINLYDRYPEKVQELKALLSNYISNGRSSKGKPQTNDKVAKWPQISWMDE